MSSPSIRKHSTSPIRNLDDRSPRPHPKLQTILEDGTLPAIVERENMSLSYENKILGERVRNFAEETTRFLAENSRLKQENQLLKDRHVTTNAVEIERLYREIMLKDAENKKLQQDVLVLKANFDRNLQHFVLQNESLKNQLLAVENRRQVEVQEIKKKYTAIAQEDLDALRKGSYDDITMLMSNLQETKALLGQKQLQIKHLTLHGHNLVKEHSMYLEQLVAQNNILRNQILQVQIKKDNEVKEASNKRELQKSRTHGIISFCKQNTSYLEKEIGRLGAELLEKSISIQQFTKDILKIRRNLEQNEKRHEDKMNKLTQSYEQKLSELQKQLQKQQKYHKQEIAEMKKREMELQEVVSTREHQIDTLEREREHNLQILKSKNNQIESLKANISKIHDDHAKEISKVMTDSRLKRKSLKNLSQVSSLRDLSADGNSSIIKRQALRANSMNQNQEGSSGQLYTVHEEMAASQLVQNDEEEDIAMKDLVLHYEAVIQQLKNNKAFEMNLANATIQKLNQSLREKQQQLLEILQRFSPLMQYKLNPASIQSDRKQKIQKHYRANIDLLSILLDKNGIAALTTK